ncbi:MAG: hypothetical protein ACSHX3_01380 [Litorimonas sp.]
MKHTNKPLTKALVFTTMTCALAFSAAAASGNNGTSLTSQKEVQVWTYEKTAITKRAKVIRIDDPLPQLIVPLNTKLDLAYTDATFVKAPTNYDQQIDLREFDLIEESPLFIGAKGATEYDTRDARRDTGSFPKTLDVDPLYTVAGAGVSTSF